MMRRVVAWIRYRWSTRRKPARFTSSDIERTWQKELHDRDESVW